MDETHYKVNNHVFATLREASAYANLYMEASGGVILLVEETKRKVTHTMQVDEKESGRNSNRKF